MSPARVSASAAASSVRAGSLVCRRGLWSSPQTPDSLSRPCAAPPLYYISMKQRRVRRTSSLPQAYQPRSVQGSSGTSSLPTPTPRPPPDVDLGYRDASCLLGVFP